jgi:hypothetical protein
MYSEIREKNQIVCLIIFHHVFQDVASIIQLKVIEEIKIDGKETSRTRLYSYNDLLDLQSRLMLVAGQAEQGKENVDRFLNVRTSF